MKHKAKTSYLLRIGVYLSLFVYASACSAGAAPTLSTPTEIPPRGRWIEVSLQEYVLRLHDGAQIVAQYPVATGAGTSPAYTTYPGVFVLDRMYRGPVETAPGVFVTDVLEFDPAHGNGIHSLPKDKDGRILDDRVGAALTAGCIRVAESSAVFNFATRDMFVWVH